MTLSFLISPVDVIAPEVIVPVPALILLLFVVIL